MPNTNPNPYESPAAVEQSQPVQPVWRWRLIPAVLFGLLGAGCFVLGMFAFFIAANAFSTREEGDPTFALIGWWCFLFLSVGISWSIAARSYWRGSYRTAIIATVIGFAIPAVMYFILAAVAFAVLS